jgi:hypothetical protein
MGAVALRRIIRRAAALFSFCSIQERHRKQSLQEPEHIKTSCFLKTGKMLQTVKNVEKCYKIRRKTWKNVTGGLEKFEKNVTIDYRRYIWEVEKC